MQLVALVQCHCDWHFAVYFIYATNSMRDCMTPPIFNQARAIPSQGASSLPHVRPLLIEWHNS